MLSPRCDDVVVDDVIVADVHYPTDHHGYHWIGKEFKAIAK